MQIIILQQVTLYNIIGYQRKVENLIHRPYLYPFRMGSDGIQIGIYHGSPFLLL